MSTEPIVGEIVAPIEVVEQSARKLLTGKYDKRFGKRTESKRKVLKANATVKSLEDNRILETSAKVYFKKMSVKAKCEELLNSSDERLRWEVCKYLWDRAYGKPYQAVNPDAVVARAGSQDNRVQVAIANLNVGVPKAQRKTQARLLAQAQALGQPIQAPENPQGGHGK